jgi:hypothetical protein
MTRDDVFNKGSDFINGLVEGFGTPRSKSIEYLRHLGFNPIKITIALCEETFVFKTEEECKKAMKAFNGETGNWGWWYSLDGEYPWEETVLEYKDLIGKIYDIR